MSTPVLLAQFTDTEIKKIRQLLSNFPYGASGENRTLVPSLENLYTNRCTTLANPTIYFIPIAFTCQKAKTKD